MPRPSVLRITPLLLILLAASLLSVAAVAQENVQEDEVDLETIVDEIQVEVVNVDVVVTDRRGNPVSGLTAEDFVLYEDGKEQEITNFYAFNDGRARREATSEETEWVDPKKRRRMAILFDTNSLEKRPRDKAIEGLERFILEQFDGTYEWAVIAHSDRIQHLQPFTSNKSTVLAALSQIRDLPVPVRRPHAGDRNVSEDPLVVSRAPGLGQFSAGDTNSGAGPRQITFQEFEQRDRMFTSLQRFDRTTTALVQTMRAYSGLPGRKSLVLISGGLESLPGPAQLFGQGTPGTNKRNDPLINAVHAELQQRYEVIIKTANAAGFAIYPISSFAGLAAKAPYLDVERTPQISFTGGFESLPPEIDAESAPKIMAEGTGGKFFSTTRYYNSFDNIDELTANAYVLGFQTRRNPDRKYHKLRVKTNRKGLRVTNREGYLHISRQDRLVNELTTPLTFPKDRGDFPIAVEIMPPEKVTAKKVTLTVAGVIPLEDVTLVPYGDEMVGRVYLYLAVYDEEGELVNLYRERQDLRLPADKIADADDNAPARFGLTVKDLKRGNYTFTLTLLDEISDRFGTGLQPVQL
ncbi:MAG: VWA domain-containing protein [Acidobacteriota bacterium]